MHRTPPSALSLAHWTSQAIDQECGPSYRQYEKARRQQYLEYFARYPDLRCPRQVHSAKSRTAALPSDCDDLATLIPRNAWHVHARSGKSSQTLALAILGSAARLDPSLAWFWRAFNLPTRTTAQPQPSFAFERSLSPADLNEKPRATVLDFAVDDPGCFVAAETKWTEAGLGTCSCIEDVTGNPNMGSHCSERVSGRQAYWQVAERYFGLPAERLPLFGCPISPVYQAVRNVAAAERLAGGKRPFAFVLLYDEQNPYFRPTGAWPGWPEVLQAHLGGHRSRGFYFCACSWQSLVPKLPLQSYVRSWLEEKHQLGTPEL